MINKSGSSRIALEVRPQLLQYEEPNKDLTEFESTKRVFRRNYGPLHQNLYRFAHEALPPYDLKCISTHRTYRYN